MTEEVPVLEEYKFGFHDNAELVMSTGHLRHVLSLQILF